MKSLTDIILRMQPYPKELKEFCNINKNFAQALKTTHPEKFISLGAVIVSHCPLVPDDEIIGFLVYAYGKNPKFKQDFIVNVGGKRQEFVIYTRFSGITKNKYIKDISHFYQKYSTYSKDSHHPKFENLPDVIKPRALKSIELAERIKKMGLRQKLTNEEYLKFDLELKKLGL